MRANAGLKNRTTPLGIRESLETHFKRYDDLKNAFEISAAAPWRSDLVLTKPPVQPENWSFSDSFVER